MNKGIYKSATYYHMSNFTLGFISRCSLVFYN